MTSFSHQVGMLLAPLRRALWAACYRRNRSVARRALTCHSTVSTPIPWVPSTWMSSQDPLQRPAARAQELLL